MPAPSPIHGSGAPSHASKPSCAANRCAKRCPPFRGSFGYHPPHVSCGPPPHSIEAAERQRGSRCQRCRHGGAGRPSARGSRRSRWRASCNVPPAGRFRRACTDRYQQLGLGNRGAPFAVQFGLKLHICRTCSWHEIEGWANAPSREQRARQRAATRIQACWRGRASRRWSSRRRAVVLGGLVAIQARHRSRRCAAAACFAAVLLLLPLLFLLLLLLLLLQDLSASGAGVSAYSPVSHTAARALAHAPVGCVVSVSVCAHITAHSLR
jgi:hypothetical protein